MDLKLGPEIIASYKRLAYDHWYALAEFIDNSTQAYFNNQAQLDESYRKNDDRLTVEIEYDYGTEGVGGFIIIKDNSIGMSIEELENAFIVGQPPMITSGRSKYGLGLKTAACWYGNYWTVNTKKLGETTEHFIEINVPDIVSKNLDLHYQENKNKDPNEHYTIITIRELNRIFRGRTNQKIKNYLRSMYRVDINRYGLKIIWNGEILKWDIDEEINDSLLKNINGEYEKTEFEFNIGNENKNKKIRGWAGVFEKGSRAKAGFSIIQADRVIMGWPSSYRPESLFGLQEGGRNDLVNQRLVGELFFENFEVSHTKDAILFSEDEEEELDKKLFEKCADLKHIASTYRKYSADERVASDVNTDAAIGEFGLELASDEIRDIIFIQEVPSSKLIKETNKSVKDSVMNKLKPSLEININDLTVYLFVVKDMSPNDPYVIIESTETKERVVVIVNRAHPYWAQLKNQDSIMNFLRHCTYDGVSEWKACFTVGNLDPDTIKKIKDNLLRLPFEIEKHQIQVK